jgi:hypothetical protein
MVHTVRYTLYKVYAVYGIRCIRYTLYKVYAVCGTHCTRAWRCNSMDYLLRFSPRAEDIRPGQQGRTCTKGNSPAREPHIPTPRAR